jgi:DNA helicase HerA-like ATPase
MLKIADNLSLPVDVVTQAIGILAIRRAGKSYTARRLVEQLYHAKQQIVIVDPKGDWWGIRSSVDGKSAGLEVPILGGEHGDIPLESGAGEVVAKMAVEEGVSLLE